MSHVNKRRKMLVDERFIRISPTLQHQATVRIIQTLLRDPECRSMMIKASWNSRESIHKRFDIEKEVEHIVQHLEMRVNTLSVPAALKTTAKRCISYMTISTVQWLVRVADSSPLRLRDQYWTGTIYELMSHLQWNSFGYVDSQKTLESYISYRETIDFFIWNQLCLHCLEADIKQFSKTIEWEECTELFFSALSVYWYWKIYEHFPKLEMYEHGIELKIRSLGRLEERRMLEHMFNPDKFQVFPMTGLTVSGIEYFRNYVNDDRVFVKFLQPTCFGNANDDAIFYLLRTIKANDIFARQSKYIVHRTRTGLGLIDPLFQQPLILFIDDWMNMFETLDMNWFCYFFDAFGVARTSLRFFYDNKAYETFQKVWRIYYKKFSLDREKMAEIFFDMFNRNDIMVCKLMLEELEDHQRINLIECARDYIEQYGPLYIKKEFSLQVAEQVLKNDTEKALFSAIPKKIESSS